MSTKILTYHDNEATFENSQKNNSQFPTKLPTGHTLNFFMGQSVYLKTDEDQQERMVTGIHLKPDGAVIYVLSLCGNDSYHYAIEMDSEKDTLKSVK